MSSHTLLMVTMAISHFVEQDRDTLVHCTHSKTLTLPRLPLSGVVTFCRDAATPLTAEEGLTGILSQQREDTVKCYGCTDSYTEEEVIIISQ